ncbi:glycosyltransferase [Streptomyces sp. ACA25]|uniref:glycosyltransferase family 2 protein n=1 Tax=Streptomyces sp. ACA25 TaxID=3022596 RepID=UPI002307D75A|nr:glycosyltransferase [Streptomyces sp. ACA25]MDB1087846.1 glycosyltransferase [Streptomyces sp. ACA25]
MGDDRTSVVIITHHRREELLHTLDRLAELPEQPAVLLTDNAVDRGPGRAAADRTGDAGSVAEAVARRHPGVRVLSPGANLGAVGRNLAARYVTTPYLAFCDDDSWWAPGSLAGAADLLDAHPRVGAVTARILVEPGGHEDPVVAELRESPVPAPPGLPGPALGSFLAAATVLRTDAFRTAGGFSPRLWLGGEEELLACDLLTAGWWLVHAGHLTVHHAPSALRDSTGRREDGIRNTLWTTWLRRPVGPALRRSGHLLRTAPRDRTTTRAIGRALAGLPWLLRERRVVPPEVENLLRPLDRAQRASKARRYVG